MRYMRENEDMTHPVRHPTCTSSVVKSYLTPLIYLQTHTQSPTSTVPRSTTTIIVATSHGFLMTLSFIEQNGLKRNETIMLQHHVGKTFYYFIMQEKEYFLFTAHTSTDMIYLYRQLEKHNDFDSYFFQSSRGSLHKSLISFH